MPEPRSDDETPLHPVPPEEGARLFATLAEELRRMAGRIAARELGHTMQPTALVNELFMKFFGGRSRSWNDEVHFKRSAAKAMRTILLDHKKAQQTQKRRAGVEAASLDSVLHQLEARCGGDLFGVHEAIESLAQEDPVLAEYVTLRFFAGRTNAEASHLLGICERTGDNHWQFARAWLKARLRP
jgi:RNA polymerase sigma factor (TIGR02999 family)